MKSFLSGFSPKSSLTAMLFSIPAIYNQKGSEQIVLYFLLGLFVLVLMKLKLGNKENKWITNASAVSLCFWLANSFRLPFQFRFEVSAFLWVAWIFLVYFVVLQPKADSKKMRVIGANFVVFLTLFSVLELPFHIPGKFSTDYLQLRLTLRTTDGGEFVLIDEKDYYQEAEAFSRKNAIMQPKDELDFILSERVKEEDGLVKLGDFDGSYINIEDGHRITTGSTDRREKRILVFGGSTIFCGEVPDSMTVPSRLQTLLDENDFEYDVINFGIPGVRIENQYNALKQISDLSTKDIVIFYDGVNDLNKIYKQGQAERFNSATQQKIRNLIVYIENRSLLLHKFSISSYINGLGPSQKFLDNEAGPQVLKNWFEFDRLARNYVESRGANFIHILQPSVVTFQFNSSSIQFGHRLDGMKVVQTYFESYATSANDIKNFAKVLNELGSTPFLDWAHLDEVGNSRVSEEMFLTLKPLLQSASD